MSDISILILAYLGYLFFWFTINLVVYFVSLSLKKPKIFEVLAGLSIGIIYIFNFLVGLWLLWIGIKLLLDGQWLWFLLYIFIGASIFSWLLALIQMPFNFILVYFSTKMEEKNFNENIVSAEILDKDGGVIGKTIEGDTAISVRMAKYFSILYLIGLINILFISSEGENTIWFGYITKPFSDVVFLTLIIGFVYIIFHKIKNKSFFPKDKRYFFIKVWKIGIYVYLFLLVILYFLNQ